MQCAFRMTPVERVVELEKELDLAKREIAVLRRSLLDSQQTVKLMADIVERLDSLYSDIMQASRSQRPLP